MKQEPKETPVSKAISRVTSGQRKPGALGAGIREKLGISKFSHPTKDCPIICIGGATDDCSIFTNLVRYLPPNLGVAVVIVNHVTTAVDLLHSVAPSCTEMVAELITDGVLIKTNHVYILDYGSDLHVMDGRFRLKPISKTTGWTDVITVFLSSLARNWRGLLVAIIVSALDGDGAAALRGIKEAGGITIAQTVETAGALDMPMSAVVSGCVDFVLSVEDIATEIVRIARDEKFSTA
jgi:two-component system chemotaxis response regulator CheB